MNATDAHPPPDLIEQQLACALTRGLGGDAKAYRAFLEQLDSLLRRFFGKRLHQRPEDLEDLVQEVLLAVHARRHTYSGRVPVTAWIHAIARYKFVDWLRSKGRAPVAEPLEAHHDVASDPIEAMHATWDLGKLLATLPAKQQLPIIYTKLQGLSVREASGLTGMTEAAIKVAVHRGLKAMGMKPAGETR